MGMRRLQFGALFGLTIGSVVPGAEIPVCPVSGDWQFTPEFSDEFNGNPA